MKNKKQVFSILIVGISLGTAWAIRGQFGHEQGAAWAGAIGCLSLLLVVKRADWFANAFSIVLAGALGWGIGGIMSYGMVVGYGRASDFVNVYYGLSMLFVIGGLYGFVGGGLLGLSLTNTSKTPINWTNIIVEMVVFGLIFYFFIIQEFEWLMTPPRSEVWAVCLGIAAALTRNMIQNKYFSALRVATFAGLGGGFGFAFGNFLQVLGQVSEIHFNFWNVMEYSLGFFGGLGMTYGILTSKWETMDIPTKRPIAQIALLMLVFVIPFIVWQQTFETERIVGMLNKLEINGDNIFVDLIHWLPLALIFIMSGIWFWQFYRTDSELKFANIYAFFIGHLGLYIIFSWFITGAFLSSYRIEQYLYLANLLVIAVLIKKTNPTFYEHGINPKKWSINLAGILIFISILALIAMGSHGELKGTKKRFNNENEMKK